MRVAVIGLGLIGGSMLRALAGTGAYELAGYDADPAVRAMARTASGQVPIGQRWRVAGSVREATDDADLVVIAVPFPAFAGIIDDLANGGYSGLITDVTSVKGPTRAVVADRWRRSGEALAGYVGGHPMAGREVGGFASADAALFRGCAWALAIEPDETPLSDWLEVARVATALGARVVPVTADEHDRAVAAVSHVPHLLAAALVRATADNPLALSLGAGSFHDGTRVAASPAALTSAMCGANHAAVATALDAVFDQLDIAEEALGKPDPITALRSWFASAAATREAWPASPSAPLELPAHPAVLLRLGRAGGWVTDVAADSTTVTGVRPQ
ncbi:MAG TPA: prephenate dehydrogenase/arogenate dehydrogenase family protein [Micromonosporaceae bacterium]